MEKSFDLPEMEITMFAVTDIITTSDDGSSPDNNSGVRPASMEDAEPFSIID